jgi:MoaA/NifB/PqqE/SkfB family radical SAM enzyme
MPPNTRVEIGSWPVDGRRIVISEERDPDGKRGKISVLARFKKIYIEITNCCNLACSFCHSSQRKKAFMIPDDFTEILRKITGYTEYIYLHVLGEPLLHPDLGFLLDISLKAGFHVNLTTNGTLLAQKGELLLSKAALRQVNISLHSGEQPGSIEALHPYLDSVLAFIGQALSLPSLLINLRLWNLHNDISGMNERILERLMLFFALPTPFSEKYIPGQNLTLAPRVFLSWDHPFVWPHAPAPDLGSYGHCRGLRDHIALLVDGTVVPCCLDAEADIPLGNIHHRDLAEILDEPRSVAMWQGFCRQRIIEPLCRRCGYRRRFI